ncbi:peptidoglycan-binding protein [Micromonospora krabiensis]|uniref:Putative peptidoglycan binding domain-containing protein n=1 Tax=Micromonospora krabiensis TaxID=307121 RepID=A0A1C3MX11_9ACTN|nr:peptidoglycan-binding protein [Micromonospora krabiensis]SBV24851.1 Putative peptidoglycan binding domain-containing protein [Micromonospora krabiensis]
MKRLVALCTMLAAVFAGTLVSANPAYARSQPECESYTYVSNQAGHQVAAPIGKYGVLPCSLLWGDGGPGTVALQWALNDCYLAPARKTLLVDDGSFGQLTFNALKFAQAQENITSDGQFGPVSRASLKFPALAGGGAKTCARLGRPIV